MTYTNNLKNREFGQEDPQNFCSERATIAEWQGASENENSEVNPTQPKPDSSSCLCITPPKTCIIGARGFIGSALSDTYLQFYPELIQTDYQSSSNLIQMDLSSDPSIATLKLDGYSHAVIAAAYPNLLMCEKDPKRAYQINVKGTLQLVEQFVERKIIPIVFSTDYVFDGQTGSYDEAAPVNPLNEYGRQKAELEKSLKKNFDGDYLLIRLSKVYGLKKGDGSLIDQMIQSLFSNQPIRAAIDQIFSPVALTDVVEQVLKLQNEDARGIYHICGVEACSRLDLARSTCKALNANENLIIPISLNDLQEPFIRPKRTDLISRKTPASLRTRLNDSIQLLTQQYTKSVNPRPF